MLVSKKTITELRDLRAESHNAIDIQLERLGVELAHLEDSATAGSSFESPIRDVTSVESEISAKERTIEQWNELSDELDTIKEAISQIDSDISSKREECEPNYETIGIAAVDAYDNAPEAFDPFQDSIIQLISLEDEIRERERDIQSLQTTDSKESFIGKTLARGRGIVRKGTLKTKNIQRGRALREIGERVCDLSIDPTNSATILAEYLIPVRQFLDDIRKLQAERTQLESNREEVHANRLEIEKNEHMRNPIRNLGHDVERLRARASEFALELGRTYIESDEKIETGSRIDGIVIEVKRLQADTDSIDALGRRVKAALEVERISTEIDAKKVSRARHEAEIEAIDQSVDDLKTKKTSQTRLRGSQNTLTEELSRYLEPDSTELNTDSG